MNVRKQKKLTCFFKKIWNFEFRRQFSLKTLKPQKQFMNKNSFEKNINLKRLALYVVLFSL